MDNGAELEELNQLNNELNNMDEQAPMVEKRDPQLTPREYELIDELNKLRTDPNSYAQLLIRRRKHFYKSEELDEGQVQNNTNIR